MATEMPTQKSSFILYYNPYSICSLMVLYTYVMKGKPIKEKDSLSWETRTVDIFHEEQLQEHFLREINDQGQVPVLTHPTELEAPIPDSLKITYLLASKYPSLMPSDKEEEIRQYLTDLHALNYFSLSFPGRPVIAKGLETSVSRRLEDPAISDEYRKALEFKLEIVKHHKTDGLKPAEVAKNETLVRELLATLEKHFDRPDRWIYGKTPTAIDAHLVVFIARMNDVGRENLIPDKLQKYGAWAMQKPEWITMMDGRKTMIPG